MPPPGVGHDPPGWCCAGRGDRSMVEVAAAASLSAGRPVERLAKRLRKIVTGRAPTSGER
ncbi:hypothetical protein DMH18_00790 [Streptomyces sp. WAC 06783]|nr:hypothetical protein DMH18_00790 [Streptomyces sp. WAC 06783]